MKRFKKRYQTWVGGLIGLSIFFLPFSCRLQVVECVVGKVGWLIWVFFFLNLPPMETLLEP